MKTSSASTIAGPIRRVLVYGANGVQGGAIARAIAEEGFEVHAVVRDRAKAEALRALGVRVVAADLEQPATLYGASQGMDAAVLTIPLVWDRETVLRWARNAAEAADRAGMALMVLNSGARLPTALTDAPGFELRRECEWVLRRFGPPLIVLRPPLFMENLTAPWIAASIARDHVLPYPVAAEVRVSWLAAVDLGAYVGAALRRPDLVGRTLDVGGPEALDGPGLARALSPELARPIAYDAVPPELIEQPLVRQLSPALARGTVLAYAWIASHPDTAIFAGTSAELERELRRKPQSVRAWASGISLVGGL